MKYPFIKCALLGSAIFLTSCEGENPFENISEVETELSENFLDAEAAISNIYNIVDIALRDSLLKEQDSSLVDGATVVRDAGVVYINYGNGVIGKDGHTRMGRIIVAETGDYFEEGGSILTTFDDYTVNDKPVNGSLGVANNGSDSLSLDVSGFSVNDDFVLNSTKSMKWKSGFDTRELESDDRYVLNGTSNGAYKTDHLVDANISDEVVFDRQCEYGFVSGKIDMSFSADTAEASTGSIDFIEDDQCNNVAQITISKDGSEISLTRQFDGF